MTDKRGSDKTYTKSDQSDDGDSHVHKGLWDRAKSLGNTVLDKGKEVGGLALDKGKEAGHDLKVAAQKHGPEALQATKDAINSPAGQKVKGLGVEVYNEEVRHGKHVANAAKNGDVRTLVVEGAPLLAGPQGYVAKEIGGKIIDKAIQQAPVEHQGTLKQAKAAKDLIGGHGFPSAQGLIVDGLTDEKKQHQIVGLGKQAAGGISDLWHKATGSGDDKEKQKAEDIEAERAYAAKHPHKGKQ